MSKLVGQQDRVFRVLDSRHDTDVSITELFLAAFNEAKYGQVTWTTRHMQQKLGPTIARLNKKLKNARIVPGDTKNTYRMLVQRKVKQGDE